MTDQSPHKVATVAPILATEPMEYVHVALIRVRDFVQEEAGNREEAGSHMSDYHNEAEEYLAIVDGAIAMLAAAPAPSSLAGGAVDKALAERLARYLSPLSFENRRRSSRNQHAANKAQSHYRKLAKNILRFPPIKAALSPEAPAREGVWPALSSDLAKEEGFESVEMLVDKARIGVALMEALPEGYCYSDCPSEIVNDLINQRDEALTPRHEAPAEPVSDRYKLAELLSNPQELEAPAEGAGETDEAFCEAYYDAHLTHAWAALRDGVPYQVNADGAISLIQQAAIDRRALRARSSAPESLGNLLAVIHRDGGHRTLEVGVERAAAEAEKIVADLLSSAPEAREGEAVGWFGDKDYEPTETMIDAGLEHCRPGNYANMIASFKAMMSQAEIDGLVAYAHPAAPIALRIAVEAWEELAKRPSWEVSFSGFDEEDGWSVHRVTGGVNDREWEELSRADTPLEAIEAALQAEGC